MHEVGVLEAKTNLSALLNEVEGGGDVVITRHGRPVARMVRFAEAPRRRRFSGEELASKVEAFQRRMVELGADPTPVAWEMVKPSAES